MKTMPCVVALGLAMFAWGALAGRAADDTSWTQARADALAIAKWEREHYVPPRPPALPPSSRQSRPRRTG